MASQKPVELGLGLALGRLDHQRAGDGEGHRRGVEAVVHEALGDVGDGDAGGLLEGAHVEDALVSDEALLALVEDVGKWPSRRLAM
jgi:hypothetical protein